MSLGTPITPTLLPAFTRPSWLGVKPIKLFCFVTLDGGLRPVPGNTKGGSITVPLTSCLTGLN
jgi:hypothetical protein